MTFFVVSNIVMALLNSLCVWVVRHSSCHTVKMAEQDVERIAEDPADAKLQATVVRRGLNLLRRQWQNVESCDGKAASMLWMNDLLLDDLTVVEFCTRFTRGQHSRRK